MSASPEARDTCCSKGRRGISCAPSDARWAVFCWQSISAAPCQRQKATSAASLTEIARHLQQPQQQQRSTQRERHQHQTGTQAKGLLQANARAKQSAYECHDESFQRSRPWPPSAGTQDHGSEAGPGAAAGFPLFGVGTSAL